MKTAATFLSVENELKPGRVIKLLTFMESLLNYSSGIVDPL